MQGFAFINLNSFTGGNALYADNLITTYPICFGEALCATALYSSNNSELMKWLTVGFMHIVQRGSIPE